jgi:hypothetical protein
MRNANNGRGISEKSFFIPLPIIPLPNSERFGDDETGVALRLPPHSVEVPAEGRGDTCEMRIRTEPLTWAAALRISALGLLSDFGFRPSEFGR